MIPIVKHQRIKSFLMSEFGFVKHPPVADNIADNDPVLSLLVRITERYKRSLNSGVISNSTADPEMAISSILEHIEVAFSGDSNSPKLPVLIKTLIESDYFYFRFYRELHSIYSVEQVGIEQFQNDLSLNASPSRKTTSLKNRSIPLSADPPIAPESTTQPSRSKLPFLLKVAFTVLSIFIVVFYFLPTTEESPLDLAYGDSPNNKPEFHSDLRSTSDSTDISPTAQKFLEVYQSGGSSYVINNFTKAIETLEPLKTAAHTLLNDSLSGTINGSIRNYFFYLGASYLTLSQQNSHEHKKSENIQQALRYLLIADSLAGKLNLPNRAREAYYIGLAHYRDQQSDLMHQYLDTIPDSSRFFQDSITLRKHLQVSTKSE